MADYEHKLTVNIVPRDETTIVEVSGSIDSMTADDLLNPILQVIEGGQARLVCDLSGVLYTSSAGLRALLASMKEARSRGGDVRLAAVADKVHKVLQMSGFTSILKLYPDVEAAVASYSTV